MSKKTKSVEDLFASEESTAPVDVSSLFINPGEKLAFPPPSTGDGSAIRESIMSFPVGAAQGISMGYADRILPKPMVEMAARNPVSSTLGKITGGLLPGMGIAKGVGAIGKAVPMLSALSKTGFLSGATEGAIGGAIADPGENGSRSTNVIIGGGLGGPIGKVSGLLKSAGKDVKVFDEINSPESNYSTKVKDMLENAVSNMMGKEVAPRQQAIKVLLNDKEIPLNPDMLRGFKRDALTGPQRKKGGLDVLASILERKQAESGTRGVRANTGQKVKQYLDSISDYAKQKPYSEAASATSDRAKYGADVLRSKLRELSPKYEELNAPMARALSVKNNLRASSDTSPMTTVASNPMTDRGQLIQELDRLAGSDLAGVGETIGAAKKLKTDPVSLAHPLKALSTKLTYAKLGAGRASNAVDRVTPGGTRQSLINSILESLKANEEEQQ